ncbi:MAG: hypothetical protein N2257_07025 [Thermodesulfovibrionales bacterium]|nr:hypothetical protein [Thermodesulfovibrionales bacterium]
MEDQEYRNIICKRFCSYYKSGKESLSCGAFNFLKLSLTPGELKGLIENKLFTPLAIEDNELCKSCKFSLNDCDFHAGLSEIPCGGYRIVKILKERNRLQFR